MSNKTCDHSCNKILPVTIVPVPRTEGLYRFSDPKGDLDVDIRHLPGNACDSGFDENSSEDFSDYNAEDPEPPIIHPCMHNILDNCIANLDWFSSRYGGGYGRLEAIGHYGVSRLEFRFKYDVDDEPQMLKESQVKSKLHEYMTNVGEESDPFAYGSEVPGRKGVFARRLTDEQLVWLRRANVYGSTFGVQGSWHYHDRAIDITWIGWNNATAERPIQRRASRPCNGLSDVQSSAAAYRRMVAVEACFRKFFGTVINRNYNKSHENHFHLDDGACVSLNLKLNTHVLFLKDCIEAFTDTRLSRHEKDEGDSEFGRHTRAYDARAKEGYRALMSDLGMERLQPEKYGSHYWLFLNYIMMHGFANERAGFYRYGDTATSPVV